MNWHSRRQYLWLIEHACNLDFVGPEERHVKRLLDRKVLPTLIVLDEGRLRETLHRHCLRIAAVWGLRKPEWSEVELRKVAQRVRNCADYGRGLFKDVHYAGADRDLELDCLSDCAHDIVDVWLVKRSHNCHIVDPDKLILIRPIDCELSQTCFMAHIKS